MYEGREFYIKEHGLSSITSRRWAILEDTKYGPRLFDVYNSENDARKASEYYGLMMI